MEARLLEGHGQAHDAPGPPAVAHDLRARAARDADLVAVHGARAEDVACEVGIRQRPASEADDARPAALDQSRGHVWEVMPQPRVPAADDHRVRPGLLDVPRDARQARHARQRVLRRLRPARQRPVRRAVHVRVEVRVARGDVHARHAGLGEPPHQADRLGEVRLRGVVSVHAPAVRMRDGVVHVQSRGHLDAVADGVAHLGDRLAEHPRASGIVAAIAAVVAHERGEQLAQQVAVAALDVDRVEAHLGRQPRRTDERLLQPLKLLVADQRVIRRQRVARVEHGRMVRDDRLRAPARPAVPTGMGELKNAHGPMPDGLVGRGVGGAQHLAEHPGGGGVEPELAGIGAAFGDDGARLPPDEARAAGGESAIAADGQLGGRPGGGGVAAFHRLGGESVGDGQPPPAHRLREQAQIVPDRQVQPLAGDVGSEFFEAAVGKPVGRDHRASRRPQRPGEHHPCGGAVAGRAKPARPVPH